MKLNETALRQIIRNELKQIKSKKFIGEASRRATNFYSDTKHGKELHSLLKGKWDVGKVEGYLDKLGAGSDIKYARLIDMVSNRAGLDITKYSTIGKQLPVLIHTLEKLYKEFLNESVIGVNKKVNENFIPNVGRIDDYKLKDLLLKNPKVNAILDDTAKAFIKKPEVVVIMHQQKRFNSIFTDGKQEIELDMKVGKVVKPLGKARKEIVSYFSNKESVNESAGTLKIEKGKDGKYYWEFKFNSGKVEKWPNGFNDKASAQKDFMYRMKYLKESTNKSKKYDIASGHMGNGLTIWNRAEEVRGDYKIIAHISDDGKLSIRDKKLPADLKNMFQIWADSMKKGNKGPEY
jgi:uncharacterized protein YegP (UPF0339 family)